MRCTHFSRVSPRANVIRPQAELTALRTSSASNAKQVDRLTLLVETLSTQKATAETHNKDLQHQVDKWQSLAGKGEKEVEALRKRRIELEVRVKELEVSLKEAHGFDKKTGKLEVQNIASSVVPAG